MNKSNSIVRRANSALDNQIQPSPRDSWIRQNAYFQSSLEKLSRWWPFSGWKLHLCKLYEIEMDTTGSEKLRNLQFPERNVRNSRWYFSDSSGIIFRSVNMYLTWLTYNFSVWLNCSCLMKNGCDTYMSQAGHWSFS